MEYKGMKGLILTCKHHDGFCLFDSKYTDFKSTNTKCGRDLVAEYVEAVRAETCREFDTAFARAVAGKGPFLIEALI